MALRLADRGAAWSRRSAPPAPATTFDTKTASFALTFHDETSAYRDAAVVVMPGAAVIFNAVGGPRRRLRARRPSDGTLVQQGTHQWRWTAPERPGTYLITFDGPGKKDAIAVHAFVMVPATEVKNGLLNGYRIGEYPATPLKGNPLYLPPPGFIEVTKENQDTRVSPHFTLKQFLCKEDTTKTLPEVRAAQGAAAAEARSGARARQRAGVQGRHAARDERVPHAVLQPRDRRREVQHASVGQRRRHLRRSARRRIGWPI